MPMGFAYLAITVVILTDNEELSPHRDIQNHRLHQNATISFGKWEGGVLQVLENEHWINQDSRNNWVFLNARDTYHRVTEVQGYRLSIIYHTPQHLNRLSTDDWEELRGAGFPVDLVWDQGLLIQEDSDEEPLSAKEINVATQYSRQPTPISEIGGSESMTEELSPNFSLMKPTMQSLLWLADVVANAQLPRQDINLKGPRMNRFMVEELELVKAYLFGLERGTLDVGSVSMFLTQALITILRLTVRLGLQCHLGVMVLQALETEEELSVDGIRVDPLKTMVMRSIDTIPVQTLWQWTPNIYGLIQLSPDTRSQ